MIFVTVGTHEQEFNRLIEYIDNLKKDGKITDDVIIQTGFSSYIPTSCKWNKFFSYDEMEAKIKEARIVITHGGPMSVMASLQIGKIPIVVPRLLEFDEHVNNHQVNFVTKLNEKKGNIISVIDISALGNIVSNYYEIASPMQSQMESNTTRFIESFECIVDELFQIQS
jgi:UDP-N-acetylglucosamine transferase subunit ALG13